MSLKTTMIIGGVILLIAGGTLAGEESVETWNDLTQVKQDRREIRQTAATLVKLAHFVDLWHDATLKGDRNLVFQRQEEIMEIIKADLGWSYQYIDECEKEWEKSGSNYAKKSLGNDGTGKIHAKTWDNRVDFKKARSIVKTKQRIAGAISRTEAFSNKLRLLGDYQELLRRELDRIELAEGINEEDEDIPGE
ncbi:MAG: hypothetical protein DRP47_09845 [Candidatus Zixiibacteriota bacterium]|nr:MAG: hypothetical protein DRP47_09845 [candidate division Zixibacteria bacterium]